jgi:hypothetical protein
VICCAFLWLKGLTVKDIQKEIFCVYDGKCFSRKAVHSLVEKFSQGRSKMANDTRPSAKVTKTTIKRLLCCGFRSIGKVMGRRRICREINIFYVHFRIS